MPLERLGYVRWIAFVFLLGFIIMIEKQTLIDEIEKIKTEALTQAQKQIEDEDFNQALDSLIAAKWMLQNCYNKLFKL